MQLKPNDHLCQNFFSPSPKVLTGSLEFIVSLRSFQDIAMQSQPAAISVSDLSDSAKRHTLRNARPQTEELRFVFDDKRQKYFRKKTSSLHLVNHPGACAIKLTSFYNTKLERLSLLFYGIICEYVRQAGMRVEPLVG